MATRVELDALIRREDFCETDEQSESPQGLVKDRLGITDLRKGEFFFAALRKPDFQRETNEWDGETILELIYIYM